ncbi:hypothetical protein ONZ45_g2775 [Pleurotus djamor]|nr:hypothetical protein ONZ45_g2775 [Pleurotus djamor]
MSLPHVDYKLPNINYSPRSTLPDQAHSLVDTALKNLKSAHSRLQTAYSEFANELQILHRLYYKGYNQHRQALFWKRTTEVRAFSRRIDKADVGRIVDALRRSFFGPDARENPKLLRGSWSHIPDTHSLSSLLSRLTEIQKLFAKAHERFLAAYLHLSMAMQSGAFIQLIVVLAASVSRLNILVDEMLSASDVALSSGRSIFLVLKNPMHSPILTVDMRQRNVNDLSDEDTGDVVSDRPIPAQPSLVVKIETPSEPPAPTHTPPVQRIVVDVPAQPQAKKPKPKEKSKPSRRKRDEIDDIFGTF